MAFKGQKRHKKTTNFGGFSAVFASLQICDLPIECRTATPGRHGTAAKHGVSKVSSVNFS